MNLSIDSFIDDLVARRTVEEYDTFRYVLIRRVQLLLLTSAPTDSIVQVPSFSALTDSERTKVIKKIQYTSDTCSSLNRVQLT